MEVKLKEHLQINVISQIIYSRLIWSEGNMIADKKKYVLIGLTIAAIFFHSELIKFFF